MDGCLDGRGVGTDTAYEGANVGDTVGLLVGAADGAGVGKFAVYVGESEGFKLGVTVGL